MAVNEVLDAKPTGLEPSGRSETRRAHLVGVAGAGMRALADVLLGHGWQLSGSDLAIGPASALARLPAARTSTWLSIHRQKKAKMSVSWRGGTGVISIYGQAAVDKSYMHNLLSP